MLLLTFLVPAAALLITANAERGAGAPAPRLVAYRVAGASMQPALRPGDEAIFEFHGSQPQRGDVVAVRLGRLARPLVKRVVAVEGDRLAFDGRSLLPDPRLLDDPYLRERSASWRGRFQVLRTQLARSGGVVPPGQVVVLGDGAGSEEDSRSYGLVSVSQLLGRLVVVRDRSGRYVERPGLPALPPALRERTALPAVVLVGGRGRTEARVTGFGDSTVAPRRGGLAAGATRTWRPR